MVSIIIVNWNGENFIGDCLKSLKGQSYRNLEIVFVDNHSDDNSLKTARAVASSIELNVKFIELGKNMGFAGGNNAGLKLCSGKYVALLNTDAVVDRHWLAKLVEAIEAHPEVGICASKLIVAEESIIDSAGDGFSTFGHAFKRGEGANPHEYSQQGYVFGACAGAALYRTDMIKQIGFFDEDFFIIFEDADLNFRAQLSGWKCLYVPSAIVYHKVGGSIKKIPALKNYYSIRNDKLLKIKNLPLTIIYRIILGLIIGELITFIYHMVEGSLKQYFKANISISRELPKFLRKRREVMNLKKVSDAYIKSILTSGFSLYSWERIKKYLAL